MKVYTYSEARQQLATVLEQAGREGGVRIRRQDGQVFVLRPEKTKSSPLDVPALDLRLTRKEIVEFVRAGRKPGLQRASRGTAERRGPSSRERASLSVTHGPATTGFHQAGPPNTRISLGKTI